MDFGYYMWISLWVLFTVGACMVVASRIWFHYKRKYMQGVINDTLNTNHRQ